jgi:hypothetical protein
MSLRNLGITPYLIPVGDYEVKLRAEVLDFQGQAGAGGFRENGFSSVLPSRHPVRNFPPGIMLFFVKDPAMILAMAQYELMEQAHAD